MAYLDDVIVLGKNCADHLENLTRVLDIFKKYNWKLKTKKCNLFQNEIKFLGKIISADGIKINPENVVTVKNCKYQKQERCRILFGIHELPSITHTRLCKDCTTIPWSCQTQRTLCLAWRQTKYLLKIKNYPSGSCQIKLPIFKR
jgi:molybdenum cofactor biosynthesis enzyme MoaA